MLFTTSWDDGHPLDMKLAELLAQHGFSGTFYVPLENQEGLPVLDTASLRQLAQAHEVGSHTAHHCYASRATPALWAREVNEGKQGLEQQLGHAVQGFCFPGGKRNRQADAVVRSAGFAYARTVVNLQLHAGSDRFAMPTTLQFYPHRRDVLLRNWLKQGQWVQRMPGLRAALSASSLHAQLMALLHQALETQGVFHLWGHSWELEKFDLWSGLDNFLRCAASEVPLAARVPNVALVKLGAPAAIGSVPA